MSSGGLMPGDELDRLLPGHTPQRVGVDGAPYTGPTPGRRLRALWALADLAAAIRLIVPLPRRRPRA